MGNRAKDCDWQYRTGRNSEGDRFALHILVHGSGRILGKVFGPSGGDDFMWRATFYCAVPKEILDTAEDFDFIDAESAQVFVDEILSQFDPTAPPKPAKPAGSPEPAKNDQVAAGPAS